MSEIPPVLPRGTIHRDAVEISGRMVQYLVRRSERAQRMRLRMLPGGVLEVVLPRGYSLREAASFVRREAGWIDRQLKRAERDAAGTGRKPRAEPLAVALVDGADLPYLGQTLRLSMLSPGTRASVKRDGERLLVSVPDPARLPEVIERWYRAEAKRVLQERVTVHALAIGVAPGKLSIKDTRSRWGSASSRGNLNFSWRLLLMPWEVMDYVAAHEVAHLHELNHSPRFWAVVEQLLPEWKTQRRWLNRNGRDAAGAL